MVGKVLCLVHLAALLVGSVMKVDLTGVVNKIRADLYFGLQVMLGFSLCVSALCALNISCANIHNVY